jgi:uncharacterized protein involved in exopolysaccharide biosynthesis
MEEKMSPETYSEEEIDVRGIIQALLKFKWWILGAAILFAVAGYAGSKLIMERTYQATAYVMIVKPSTIVNFEAGIESSPQLPDAKSMTDLTLADDLVNKVLQDPQVTVLFKEPISHNDFRGQLSSTLVGGNQLRLEVTDTEPEHAAVIANVWAQNVASRFNSLFGSGTTELEQLDSQVEQSRLEWDTSEQALLDYLENTDVDAWRISLEQQKLALGELVTKVEEIDVLFSNVQTLEAQLESQSYKDPLSVENALSLVILNQQAIGLVENLQIQISLETTPSLETTVGEARDSLTGLISALEQQKEELAKTVSDKSDRITYLAARYESVRYEVDQLTLQRDLSRQAYEALSTHAVEVQILSANNDQIAKVAGEALPPVNPSSPKTMFNTAIAGIIGLALSTVFILAWDWWKSPKSDG